MLSMRTMLFTAGAMLGAACGLVLATRTLDSARNVMARARLETRLAEIRRAG